MSSRRKVADTPAESTRASVLYVYGIGGTALRTEGAPAGIDGRPVAPVEGAGLTALVSDLDADAYAPEKIEAGVGDVEWIAPRAAAHDAVVTWASQPGPIVPLHMWTLFADSGAVAGMLAQRAPEVRPLLERLRDADEYGLRVFADAAALAEVAEQRDDTLTELRRSAATAGPGQKYLIERKIEGARGEAVRSIARDMAGAIYERLSAWAQKAASDPLPASSVGEAAAILSAAFLVGRAGMPEFQTALTELVTEYEPQGLRFVFTGPWPAYHFARGEPGNGGENTGARGGEDNS